MLRRNILKVNWSLVLGLKGQITYTSLYLPDDAKYVSINFLLRLRLPSVSPKKFNELGVWNIQPWMNLMVAIQVCISPDNALIVWNIYWGEREILLFFILWNVTKHPWYTATNVWGTINEIKHIVFDDNLIKTEPLFTPYFKNY